VPMQYGCSLMPLNKKLDPTPTGQYAERLCTDLHNKIVEQDEAIDQIVNTYQMYLAGMISPCRPIGNFLFLGPTGSGKTRLVEAVAQSLVGEAHAIVKIDRREFQHSHQIAKLIGSPPGHMGLRETHPLLSRQVLDQYHTEKIKLSFVLFDEIEKQWPRAYFFRNGCGFVSAGSSERWCQESEILASRRKMKG